MMLDQRWVITQIAFLLWDTAVLTNSFFFLFKFSPLQGTVPTAPASDPGDSKGDGSWTGDGLGAAGLPLPVLSECGQMESFLM